MDRITMFKEMREALMAFASEAPDGKAAKFPSLFKPWAAGLNIKKGERREYGGKLYKSQQDHTSQIGWEPDVTPALWAVIDAEHEGTAEDPIPASRGMEYTFGLYYTDPEDGQLYICQRVGEAEGGTVVLQYLPHELVGQYFEAEAMTA